MVADQHLVGPIGVVHAGAAVRLGRGWEGDGLLCQLFFHHDDAGAVIGILDVVEERVNVLYRADTANPGAVVARRAGEGVDIARHVEALFMDAIWMRDAVVGEDLLGARDDPGVNRRVCHLRIGHPDQGHGGTAVFRVGNAEFKQVGVAHPFIEGRAVQFGAAVHLLDRTDHLLHPQQAESGFGESQCRKGVDDATDHPVFARVVEGPKFHRALARQRHLRINRCCKFQLTRNGPGRILLVLFDQGQRGGREGDEEIARDTANRLLERHEQAAL